MQDYQLPLHRVECWNRVIYSSFYPPKVRSKKVESIEDVRRFFMVLAPESKNKKNLYRLFVIGKKSLPEIRKTEARSALRYWQE